MKGFLSTRLVSRLTGLLVLTAALAGCNASRQEEKPILPVTHSASVDSVQFFSVSPSEIRHQQRMARTPQVHRRPQSHWPQAPVAIN